MAAAGRTFTPLERPPQSAAGLQASARADLVMQTRGSRFVKFQEARIQELASEVHTSQNLKAATRAPLRFRAAPSPLAAIPNQEHARPFQIYFVTNTQNINQSVCMFGCSICYPGSRRDAAARAILAAPRITIRVVKAHCQDCVRRIMALSGWILVPKCAGAQFSSP